MSDKQQRMPRFFKAGFVTAEIKNLYLEQSSSQLRKDAPEFIPSVGRVQIKDRGKRKDETRI